MGIGDAVEDVCGITWEFEIFVVWLRVVEAEEETTCRAGGEAHVIEKGVVKDM